LGGAPVVADARCALEALSAALGNWATGEPYRGEARSARDDWAERVRRDLEPARERMTQGQAIQVINRGARRGDWLVAAAGAPPGDLLKLWRCPPGSSAHIEFAFSCMGHEIPAGLGIRMADPDAEEILVVIGDGTYLMAPTELVTAAQEGLKITVIVLVNGGYQSIHELQRSAVARSMGTEFRRAGADGEVISIDYAANARSLGCRAFHAADPDALRLALDAAREGSGPAVVVCDVHPSAPVLGSGAWWDLGVPEVSGDAEVVRLAQQHGRVAAARRRFYG
ncbi:MAG: thiamine pyrophosphate-dependent enzyme, partial [Solirubrobacteraceae bacterium]